MAIKKDREYRNVALTEFRALDEEGQYIVEGYATTFGSPYLLWEDWEGNKYYEEIDRNAFDDAVMNDVVFLFNHEGMVFARTKNGSVKLTIDDHGLKVRADLGLTQAAREMYEAIKTGLIDSMSWAFRVKEDSYNRENKTRTILKVSKIYDVSAVTFPANPETEISARNYVNGVIDAMKAERLDLDKRRLNLKNKNV